MPAEDFITCDFPDLDSFIRQLDLFNDHVNKALVAGMYTGADMIKNEQKRLISGKSRRLSAAIDKSEIKVTKSGSLKVTSGYQADSFKIDDIHELIDIMSIAEVLETSVNKYEIASYEVSKNELFNYLNKLLLENKDAVEVSCNKIEGVPVLFFKENDTVIDCIVLR